ncbi:MAG: MaoC family dehydratase [Pseudomonadales bacterium]|nr:MaoC family dehydratase [Pseudomonadales bacterium]MBO6594838.1 MaoC family dehydratase [Pseudomonadales bacterium]MBO6821602.1 MaoC family dehydratase [Pseudomonadales bacterium]
MSEIEEILEAAVLQKRGQSFYEFEVGEEIHHHWGRTITEADAIQFAHLTLAYNPLYFNREYAIELGHPDIVVCPQLVFNVILGLSVEICSEGLGGPFLGVYDLKYLEPVYPGDTLTSVSKTVAKRESESSEGRGVLTWFNEGFNQHDRKVIEYRRSNLAIWKGGLGAPKIKKENADG